MGWFQKHKKVRSGGIFEAQDQRQMAQTCDWASQMRVAPPLSMTTTGNGPLIRLAGMLLDVRIGVVATAIGPRSGSTPGQGTVTLQTWNGTTLASLSGVSPVTAYNISAASGGIPSGKYCIILKIAGAYFVITAEC